MNNIIIFVRTLASIPILGVYVVITDAMKEPESAPEVTMLGMKSSNQKV